MEINKYNNLYFIGIGGIGMSAIARYFKSLGRNVAGYDKTKTKITNSLTKEGIDITFSDKIKEIPEKYRDSQNTLIIYTPAIPVTHSQLNYFKNNRFKIIKRAEALGLISKGKKTIGVAGTHGKTTVSTMIAHIFHQSHLGCNAFLGGISQNHDTNLLISEKSPWFVVEADEFDRSFLQLHPEIAVVTSMDADHLDIYGNKNEMDQSFQHYIDKINEKGKLIYKKGLKLNTEKKDAFTYDIEQEADFYALNLYLEKDVYVFDLHTPKGLIEKLQLSYPGKINVENAVAASAVALLCGVTEDELRKALNNFKGVWRRFDYRIRTEKLIFIDDYAHHPRELEAIITSVKQIYPNKKITGIFQPHLYTRTRDFAKEFAQSLNLLDELILLEIYPARELPIKGITSKIILEMINIPAEICSKDELLKTLKKKTPEVLLTLGAGDIDKLVEPIKNQLLVNEQ